MTVAEPDIDGLERRMTSAVEVLRKEFAGLRAGRASVSLLEPLSVDAYGTEMKLNQLATISAPESRLLTVQVWDKGLVKDVQKAIQTSELGLNPATDGQLIRVPLPELNEERRRELSKIAGKYAEQARVAVRNVRRDGMDKLKRMEKSGEMSQDDHHLWAGEIQEMTDKIVKEIDQCLDTKEKEIMQV